MYNATVGRRPHFLVRAVFALTVVAAAACTTTAPPRKAPEKPAGNPDSADAPPPKSQAVLKSGASVPLDRAVELTPENARMDAEQESLAAYLLPLKAEVDAAAERVVGTLGTDLVRSRDGESTMGNFATDSMRTALFAVTGERADACFTNMGGLRIDVPQGEIKAGTLIEVMPFDNSIVVFSMRGDRLKQLVTHLADRGDPISGVRYAKSAPAAETTTVNGNVIDDAKAYRLCTNDYVYEGGAEYALDEGTFDVAPTGFLLRDALFYTFEQSKGAPVVVETDGRVAP